MTHTRRGDLSLDSLSEADVNSWVAYQAASWRRSLSRCVSLSNEPTVRLSGVRWSWFVGQFEGWIKVYSDWFGTLDERNLPTGRDDVNGIVEDRPQPSL